MSTTTDSNRLVILVLAALALLLSLPVLFVGGMMGWGMPMMGWMWGSSAGGTAPTWLPLVGLVAQLLLLALVVFAGYLLFRAVAGGETSDADRALDELRVAYARGKLTDEEYERRRAVLRRDE